MFSSRICNSEPTIKFNCELPEVEPLSMLLGGITVQWKWKCLPNNSHIW